MDATVPMGPKRYTIGPSDKPDGFTDLVCPTPGNGVCE